MRHAFVEHPWKKPICDAKVDDNGRSRTCCEPPEAEVHQGAVAPRRHAGDFDSLSGAPVDRAPCQGTEQGKPCVFAAWHDGPCQFEDAPADHAFEGLDGIADCRICDLPREKHNS